MIIFVEKLSDGRRSHSIKNIKYHDNSLTSAPKFPILTGMTLFILYRARGETTVFRITNFSI